MYGGGAPLGSCPLAPIQNQADKRKKRKDRTMRTVSQGISTQEMSIVSGDIRDLTSHLLQEHSYS